LSAVREDVLAVTVDAAEWLAAVGAMRGVCDQRRRHVEVEHAAIGKRHDAARLAVADGAVAIVYGWLGAFLGLVVAVLRQRGGGRAEKERRRQRQEHRAQAGGQQEKHWMAFRLAHANQSLSCPFHNSALLAVR